MRAHRYRAVVTGSLQPEEGEVTTPMHGKECLTRFRVVRREWRDNIPGWVTVVDL